MKRVCSLSVIFLLGLSACTTTQPPIECPTLPPLDEEMMEPPGELKPIKPSAHVLRTMLLATNGRTI